MVSFSLALATPTIGPPPNTCTVDELLPGELVLVDELCVPEHAEPDESPGEDEEDEEDPVVVEEESGCKDVLVCVDCAALITAAFCAAPNSENFWLLGLWVAGPPSVGTPGGTPGVVAPAMPGPNDIFTSP